MPPPLRLLGADGQGQRSIQLQPDYCGAADRRFPENSTPTPLEVIAPPLPAWIENRRRVPVLWSTSSTRAPLRSDQETQASARFSDIVSPPLATGSTWSK